MATIRSQFLVTSILLVLLAGELRGQGDAKAPRRRPSGNARAATKASDQPTATAKPRTDTPRQDDDPAAHALVRGTARDPSGKPVPGATVWLVTRRGDELDRPLVASTDANGRFSFAEVDEQTLFAAGEQTAAVIARDADGRLGWFELRRGLPGQTPCEVRLHEAAEITGRIVDAEGRPVAGAKLTVESLYEPLGRTERRLGPPIGPTQLFPDLAAEYQTSAGGDGGFQLSRLPQGVRIYCELSAPGIDQVRVVLDAGHRATLRLGQPGSIAGSVAVADEELAAAKGFQVRVNLQSQEVEGDEVPLSYTDSVAIDETGAFHFDGLPPGRYVIEPVARQNAPFYADATLTVEIAPGQRVSDLSLPLKRGQTLRGSVIDSRTGKGIAGVQLSLYSTSSRQQTVNDSQTAVTDGDGSFTVWLKPGEVSVSVSRVPEEYLPPPADKRPPREVTSGQWPPIALDRAVQVEGIVVDEAGMPVPLAELQVNQSPFHRGAFPQQADRSGKFLLRQVDPAEPISVRARTATMTSDAGFQIASPADASPVTIVVSPKAACWVSGQVVDEAGRPLPQALVAIVAMHDYYRTASGTYHNTSTDLPIVAADGTFESDAWWAGDQLRLQVSLPGFGPLETGRVRGEPGMVHDFGPLMLRRMLDAAVQVVDEAGQPVPGATVHVMPTESARRRAKAVLSDLVPYETDSEGKCVVPGLEPSDTLSVWARSGGAVSAGAEVAWGPRLQRPTRIVVSEKHACRLAGRVTNRQGRPVSGAKVAVVWDRRSDWRVSGQRPTARSEADGPQGLGVCSTDAGGAFHTSALWPDEHYYVVISADGVETVESPIVLLSADETRDLGTFSPRRCDLALEGRVVDAAGEPIEGAAVVNSGDALEPLKVTTDAEGRFRLEGLLEGRVYALVRKPGYAIAGLRATAGDRELIARLQPRDSVEENDAPSDDANRRTSAALAAPPSADESRLVARLLSELWKLRDRADRPHPSGLPVHESSTHIVHCLATVDLAQALRWSAVVGGRCDRTARLAAAERLADENIDEAISLISGIDPKSAGNALRKMARRRLLAGASHDAARLLRAAAESGRTAEGCEAQAELGALAVAAGDYEWGRSLIEQAVEELNSQPANRFTGQPQAAVFAALAAVDAKRAIRLWETFRIPSTAPKEFYNDLANAAVAMAPSDLRGARTLLKLFEQRANSRGSLRAPADSARMKIAYRLAAEQPQVAIGLLDEMALTDVRTKADAHGWLARAIAPKNQRLAEDLIDRAFELYLDRLGAQRLNDDVGGPPVDAARLALHAQACGYADLRSIVDRVLAVRLTPAGEQSRAVGLRAPSPATLVESTVNTARLLALIDREVACELLLSAEPQAHLIGTSGGSVPRGAWLQAWALVDLERAEKLFAEELSAQRLQARPELIDSGLLPMLDLLSQPPSERARFLLSNPRGVFWFPGED